MSTDLQKYSTENQLHTIRRYAEQRGFTIVRVFEDSGRSGLRMDGRDGLQSLMLEVQSGAAGFQAILVYDVSRWGRFQDADEGAYHEHVCSRAGIRVHYCAEQFDNDGSIGSILLKNVKRVMAGEYSRELGPLSTSVAIIIPTKNCSPCFKPSLTKRDRCLVLSSMSATACHRQVCTGTDSEAS